MSTKILIYVIGIVILILGILMFGFGISMFTYQGNNITEFESEMGKYSFIWCLPTMAIGIGVIFKSGLEKIIFTLAVS